MNDFEMETWDANLITKDNYDYKKSMLGRNTSSGYFMPPHSKWNFHISIIMSGVLPSPVDILCIGVDNYSYRYLKHADMPWGNKTSMEFLDIVDLIGPMQKGDWIYEYPLPHTRNLTKEFRHPDHICTEWDVLGDEHIVGLNTDMSYVCFHPRNPFKKHPNQVFWIDDTRFRDYVASKVYGVDMFLQEGLINILNLDLAKRKETLKEQELLNWKNDPSIIL
tara:strand:+ start:21 stop:683 length:663 start_codon:yes stop_codon:yes gene_type:complete